MMLVWLRILSFEYQPIRQFSLQVSFADKVVSIGPILHMIQ
jgi:hypothetical protein